MQIIIKYLSAGLISRPSVGINVGIQGKKPTIAFDLKGNIYVGLPFPKVVEGKTLSDFTIAKFPATGRKFIYHDGSQKTHVIGHCEHTVAMTIPIPAVYPLCYIVCLSVRLQNW